MNTSDFEWRRSRLIGIPAARYEYARIDDDQMRECVPQVDAKLILGLGREGVEDAEADAPHLEIGWVLQIGIFFRFILPSRIQADL